MTINFDWAKLIMSSTKCYICGGDGANVINTRHALYSGGYHTECGEKLCKCAGCGKELPYKDMNVSYWHAFTWRCDDCEKAMK